MNKVLGLVVVADAFRPLASVST